jgi:hypothetical protein
MSEQIIVNKRQSYKKLIKSLKKSTKSNKTNNTHILKNVGGGAFKKVDKI